MSVIRVIDIIGRVQDILLDKASSTRWTRVELQNWLNSAYREIVKLRPDANAKTGTHLCASGDRQDIRNTAGLEQALRLIDIVHNTASSSNKQPVRLIDESIMDEYLPDWHNADSSINIQHYIFNDQLPTQFQCYPPATNTAELEVIYSVVPDLHALTENELDPAGAQADTINLDDSYESAIIDYILWRALSKNAANKSFAANAAEHYASFLQTLGAKSESDAATSPNATRST